MVIEILLDGKIVSTRNLSEQAQGGTDPRLLKRMALQLALAANELSPSEALRVTFRNKDS